MTQETPRVALVTGSGKRRVGNTVARALAAVGYDVAIHYQTSTEDARRTVEDLQRLGRRAAAFGGDVSNEDHVERIFHDVLEQFGRLDLLVTAAAVWWPKSLEETDAALIRRQFEINTLGTFLCARRAGLTMAAQAEGGAIVAIGDWAIARPYRDYAAYFLSKGAIPTLTRMLAVELAARNPRVRVNCIEPGPVMMPADLPPGERAEAVSGTLLRREGRPENVAQAVLFLAQNDYITGACLPVDGGRLIAGCGDWP